MFAKVLKETGTIKERMDDGSSIRALPSLCNSCLHFDRDTGGTCEAFPKGIPLSIMLGEFDHTFEYNMFGDDDQGVTYSKG